jgi:hypothetical protein
MSRPVPPRARMTRLARETYAVLAAAAAVILALEYLRGKPPLYTSLAWPLLEAAVAASALVVAWRRQNELGVLPVVGFALAFQVAWIGLHLARGVPSDYDSQITYRDEGNALLHGRYPPSEYPPGAVLLFALDALLGGGQTRVSHAFVMVPFQLLLVLAIWSLRTPWSPWFATIAAFWPPDAFITEFKFDVVPAALLVLGIVFALRDRWFLAGVVLGLGTAVKWTPALAVAALALWLLTTARRGVAARLLAGAAIAFLTVNLPFLVWSPHQVLGAYSIQGPRGITGESLAYVPLKALDLAQVSRPWEAAAVPGWANAAAVAIQGMALIGTLAAVVAARRDSRAVLSIAAVSPIVFLVFNRVFSPQFLIMLIAAWFVAGSLLARTRTDQLMLGGLVLCSSLANTLVYPTLPRLWQYFSALLFAFALAATGWVFVRAMRFEPRAKRHAGD